jgi:hypothetical protein
MRIFDFSVCDVICWLGTQASLFHLSSYPPTPNIIAVRPFELLYHYSFGLLWWLPDDAKEASAILLIWLHIVILFLILILPLFSMCQNHATMLHGLLAFPSMLCNTNI